MRYEVKRDLLKSQATTNVEPIGGGASRVTAEFVGERVSVNALSSSVHHILMAEDDALARLATGLNTKLRQLLTVAEAEESE